MLIKENAAKLENARSDLSIIFHSNSNCFCQHYGESPDAHGSAVYIMSKRWISWLCFKHGDIFNFYRNWRLLNMERVLVILLLMCLIAFFQLHERFVSTRDLCIINNCRQNSPKYKSVHLKQSIGDYCSGLSSNK